MEQYIPKSTLVAEIEKLIDEIYAGQPFDSLSSEQQTALWYIKSVMSSINSLEVKEVDSEEAAKNYMRSQNPPIWGLYYGFKAGAQWQKEQMILITKT